MPASWSFRLQRVPPWRRRKNPTTMDRSKKLLPLVRRSRAPTFVTRWRYRLSQLPTSRSSVSTRAMNCSNSWPSRARTSSSSPRTSAAASTLRAATSAPTTSATSAPATPSCCSTAAGWSMPRATRPKRSAAASYPSTRSTRSHYPCSVSSASRSCATVHRLSMARTPLPAWSTTF